MSERLEAVAEALEARSENDDWEWCLGDAEAALAAADAVMFNDETVEELTQVIKNAVEFTPYWQEDDPTTHQYPYQNAARAVIAALKGES